MRNAKWLVLAGLGLLVAGCYQDGYQNQAYNGGYGYSRGYANGGYNNGGYNNSGYWNSPRRDYDRDGVPNRYDRDANGDGVPDNGTAINSTGPLAAGGTFRFVVAGTVPAGQRCHLTWLLCRLRLASFPNRYASCSRRPISRTRS